MRLKPLPEPQLQERHTRVQDNRQDYSWRYYDLAQRKPQTHRSLNGASRKGLAVILGVIVIVGAVAWVLGR